MVKKINKSNIKNNDNHEKVNVFGSMCDSTDCLRQQVENQSHDDSERLSESYHRGT
ncbi:MAG: hypothetical protein J6N73_01265 [Prevotella sp.]|nr:hypothetical protein [Prevotella sp.]